MWTVTSLTSLYVTPFDIRLQKSKDKFENPLRSRNTLPSPNPKERGRGEDLARAHQLRGPAREPQLHGFICHLNEAGDGLILNQLRSLAYGPSLHYVYGCCDAIKVVLSPDAAASVLWIFHQRRPSVLYFPLPPPWRRWQMNSLQENAIDLHPYSPIVQIFREDSSKFKRYWFTVKILTNQKYFSVRQT